MPTLGGQVNMLEDFRNRQRAKVNALGYPLETLQEATFFLEQLQGVTLKTTTPLSLNDASWDFIDWAARAGLAPLFWNVGDRKAVTLSGSVDGIDLSGTYYAYILGFNHNSALEGNNLMHFEFGFTSLTGGDHLCFVSKYNNYNTSQPYGFCWNGSNSNTGGWDSSNLRNNFLNGDKGFIKLLPSDLAKVIRPVTKYTDNVAGSDDASHVTATQEKLFILNYTEVFGTRSSLQTQEEYNKTKQYDYYKNGNSKLKVGQIVPSQTSIRWYVRTPSNQNNDCIMVSESGGGYFTTDPNRHRGISPAFCVGGALNV